MLKSLEKNQVSFVKKSGGQGGEEDNQGLCKYAHVRESTGKRARCARGDHLLKSDSITNTQRPCQRGTAQLELI